MQVVIGCMLKGTIGYNGEDERTYLTGGCCHGRRQHIYKQADVYNLDLHQLIPFNHPTYILIQHFIIMFIMPLWAYLLRPREAICDCEFPPQGLSHLFSSQYS